MVVLMSDRQIYDDDFQIWPTISSFLVLGDDVCNCPVDIKSHNKNIQNVAPNSHHNFLIHVHVIQNLFFSKKPQAFLQPTQGYISSLLLERSNGGTYPWAGQGAFFPRYNFLGTCIVIPHFIVDFCLTFDINVVFFIYTIQPVAGWT